jgi:hypothetical protein
MEAGMTFGEALEEAKQGRKRARDGWNGKGMFVYLQSDSIVTRRQCQNEHLREAAGDEGWIRIRPHLDMLTAQGDIQVGWLASQSDMLGNDWRALH